MTPKILNFGSINIDHVYRVERFPRPGETVNSLSYSILAGGKGANQTVSLARAGISVYHAGKIGEDGIWLKDKLQSIGVEIKHVTIDKMPTGHAIVHVTEKGQNTITLFAGANKTISEKEIDEVLTYFSEGDYLLVQNEINNVDYILQKAKQKKMIICFNPAPFEKLVRSYHLQNVDIFFLNALEGSGLTGEKIHQKIITQLARKNPKSTIILTLGKNGAIYYYQGNFYHIKAKDVHVVDSTAAGDTFIGYWLASHIKGEDIHQSLNIATTAASICIQKTGAIDSIPYYEEVISCLN